MARFWPLASTPTGGTDGSSFTLGNAGHATNSGKITQLWFYRSNTASSGIPQSLKLFDVVSQALLASADLTSTTSGVGWKAFDLIPSVNIDSGQIVTVAAYWPAGRTFTRVTGASKPTPESPLVWETSFNRSHFGSEAFPEVTGTAQCEGVDITFGETDVPEPTVQPVNFDIENAFVRWLSSGTDNTRRTEIPWIQWVAIQAIKTVTDALPASLTALATDVGTALTRTAGLTGGTVQAALTATQTALDAAITSVGTGVSAVGTGVSAIGAVITGTLELLANGPQGMAVDTDPGWVEVDSGTFSGHFTVLERCDRVYVHITTVGADNTTSTLGSWDFGSFAWPWYPLLGNMIGRHRTSRAREAVLYEPGMRMDGVLVQLPADFEGTYSAVRFDG